MGESHKYEIVWCWEKEAKGARHWRRCALQLHVYNVQNGGNSLAVHCFHGRGHKFDPWSGNQDPASHLAQQINFKKYKAAKMNLTLYRFGRVVTFQSRVLLCLERVWGGFCKVAASSISWCVWQSNNCLHFIKTHQIFVHSSISMLHVCSVAPLSLEFPRQEQAIISYSRGSSWPRDWICISCISCIGRQILYHWATWEAP